MTIRTSMPSRRRAFGSAPTTSPSPPVLANGAHSELTTRTFSGTASRRVDAVVHVRKDVVLALDVGEPRLADGSSAEVVVEAVEAEDVLVHPARRVRDGRPGAHDEGPVARLREHELAGGLVERAPDEPVRRREAARELDHPLAGDV